MKRIIIGVLVLAVSVFLIIFFYNMTTFAKGIKKDTKNEKLKIKGTIEEGVLLIPEDSLKIIIEK